MLFIDFKLPPKQTLKRATLKGMAAPVMLYGNFSAQKLQPVRKIEINSKSTHQALSSDWNAVRSDMHNAVMKYGKTQKA
jgi:hypothetical protein